MSIIISKRNKLCSYLDREAIFEATFIKFGKTTKGIIQKTVLLVNIKNEKGHILADHLWIKNTQEIEDLFLKKEIKMNDPIKFKATCIKRISDLKSTRQTWKDDFSFKDVIDVKKIATSENIVVG